MKVESFEIEGLKLIELKSFADSRGFFVERFNVEKFKEFSLPTSFVQDNFSRSEPGVLRGLHFQSNPDQGKLVTCTRGEIFDVAVDIRKNSPTFGRHVSVRLNGDRPQWFWIPAGFAHGFQVMSSEPADVLYKVDGLYSSSGEGAICWNDPELNIDWPQTSPRLSHKDEAALSFAAYKQSPVF